MKVLFWNVWCFPKWITKSNMTDIERANKIVEYIKDYDIVLLCEAWTDASKEIFKKAYNYHYQTTYPYHVAYDSGLLVLSNYKLEKVDCEVYKHAANWDWYASKGIVKVSILVENISYCIFFTHMQAGFDKLDQCARKEQTLQLINYYNKQKDSLLNEEIFLIGDLNMMPCIWENNKRIISGHCENLEDNILRSSCFSMLLNETGLKDIKPDNSVYKFLTTSEKDVQITYYSSNGLSDGGYVVINII